MRISGPFFIGFILLFVSAPLKSQKNSVDSFFHPDTLRQIVEVLAADSLKGRFTGTAECNLAAEYIGNQFKQAGVNPLAGNTGYFMEVKPGWFNVVGAIAGKSKPEEVIIFSAHYDHLGDWSTNPNPQISKRKRKNDDSIYNGANDNASGVSAVISLAKYFKSADNNERTILFVAFTGEELGLLGSEFFVENFLPDSIKAVINIEMIGRAYNKKAKPYYTGHRVSNLPEIMNAGLFKNNQAVYGRNYFEQDPFFNQFLFERSDNFPFSKSGIPAHTIMATSPGDKYYHSVKDETETLDFNLMSKIIQAIAISTADIVSGKETPIQLVK